MSKSINCLYQTQLVTEMSEQVSLPTEKREEENDYVTLVTAFRLTKYNCNIIKRPVDRREKITLPKDIIEKAERNTNYNQRESSEERKSQKQIPSSNENSYASLPKCSKQSREIKGLRPVGEQKCSIL